MAGREFGGKQIIRRVNTRGSVEALFVFAEMIYSYQRDGRRRRQEENCFPSALSIRGVHSHHLMRPELAELKIPKGQRFLGSASFTCRSAWLAGPETRLTFHSFERVEFGSAARS